LDNIELLGLGYGITESCTVEYGVLFGGTYEKYQGMESTEMTPHGGAEKILEVLVGGLLVMEGIFSGHHPTTQALVMSGDLERCLKKLDL
jgi:hypothetical protein